MALINNVMYCLLCGFDITFQHKSKYFIHIINIKRLLSYGCVQDQFVQFIV